MTDTSNSSPIAPVTPVDFRKSFPIDFSLFDKNSQNVLYIEDSSDQQLTLQIMNSSTQDINFQPLTGDVSPTNYHFALKFRCGTLSASSLQGANCIQLTDDSKKDWDMTTPQLNIDGMDVLYLKRKSPSEYIFNHKPDKPGDTSNLINIQLSNVGADGRGGARGTRVMLHAINMKYPNGPLFDSYREIHMGIINHRGKKNIPLQLAFAGSNFVVNDGQDNTLKLRIINIAPYDGTNPNGADITLEKDTAFMLSFSSEDQFGLASDDAIKVFCIPSTSQLKIDPSSEQGNKIFWKISPVAPVTLKSIADPAKGQSFIEIDIGNIKTNYSAGPTNLLLHYKNIPGYWDGSFVCIIEKSPVKIDGTRVGIFGTGASDNPQLRILSAAEPVMTYYGYNYAEKSTKKYLTIGCYGDEENNIENYTRDLVVKQNEFEIARFTTADHIKGTSGFTVDGRIKSNGASPGIYFGDNQMAGDAGDGYVGLYNKGQNDPQGLKAWGLTMNTEGDVNILGKLGVGKAKADAPATQLDVSGDIKCASLYLGNDNAYAIKIYDQLISFYNGGDQAHVLIDSTGLTTVNKLKTNGDVVIKGNLFLKKVSIKPPEYDDYSPYLVCHLCENGGDGEVYYFDSDSDVRLKKNIATIPDALQKLLKLRGVSYQWNEDGLQKKTKDVEEKYRSIPDTPEENARVWKEQKQRIRKENEKTFRGFIAQEVETLFPDWVKDNEDGYKSINMTELAPVMVEAIKTQQQQIDTLQAQVQQLMKEMKQMMEKV